MPYTPVCVYTLCPSPCRHKSAARRVENSTGCPENRQQQKEQQHVRESGWKTVWPVTHNNKSDK